jgi:hypothetical protein
MQPRGSRRLGSTGLSHVISLVRPGEWASAGRFREFQGRFFPEFVES